MQRQHLSQTKNAIASPQPENEIVRSSTHPIEELQGAIGNRAVISKSAIALSGRH
jgi:hypothetical protein